VRADNRTTRECSGRVTIRSQNAVAAVAYCSSDAVMVMLFFTPLPHTIHGIEASSGRKSLRPDGLALLVLRIERAAISAIKMETL